MAMLSVYLHAYILSVAPYLLYVQRMIGAFDINRRARPRFALQQGSVTQHPFGRSRIQEKADTSTPSVLAAAESCLLLVSTASG